MEENKIIAEFMGLNINDITPKEFGKLPQIDKVWFNGHFIEDLQFHTSWNWLMPVVKKIVRDVKFDIDYEDEYREHLMDVVPFAEIEDVYKSVVEFIKNQNT